MEGVEFVDSFNLNPHKWLLVNFDCSVTWFKAPFDGVSRVGSAMLDGERTFREGGDNTEGGGGVKIPDYRHWQIPFGRRYHLSD